MVIFLFVFLFQIVVESGVCKRLVQLLDHPSSQVVKPALRTIGNVVCAEDDADYTEAILEAGSVVCLKKLIAHPNREIQKEVRSIRSLYFGCLVCFGSICFTSRTAVYDLSYVSYGLEWM